MNKTLTSIFETQGCQLLDISKKKFLNDSIFEEFIDTCLFDRLKLFNCSFYESEILGTNFISCSFNNTIIRKSEFTDCEFKNCQFIGCKLTPRTNFFRTVFLNCQFTNVDFSYTSLFECEFIKINLLKVKFEATFIVELKTKYVTFHDLEFNSTKPMRLFKSEEDFFSNESIKITNSLAFQKEI